MSTVTDADVTAIPGWFGQPDIDLFRLLLDATAADGGDLAELGVYLGRSAVLLGGSLQGGETLTVIDTFGTEAGDAENQRENDEQYATLTRRQFQENYARTLGHDAPVTVVEGLTSQILDHASEDAHRFVHVDASHLYEHVATDLVSSRRLLKRDGVLALDDYRSAHTPGTAAAAWQAVADGLRPFALTEVKMYATWGDHRRWFDVVAQWLEGTQYEREVQYIDGLAVHRLWTANRGRSRFVPPVLRPIASRAYERVKVSRGHT